MSQHKLIRISSFERDYAQSVSSSDFKISFNNAPALQRVKSVIVKNVSIPNVGYNITDQTGIGGQPGNNVFTYNIAGSPTSITLTPGFYDINQLITALTTDPNGVAVGLAIVLNNITGKLEFSSTTPIEYVPLTFNPMSRTLGIIDGSGGDVLTFNAEGLPDLTGDTELYIASETVSDGSNLVDAVLQAVPVVAVVPIRVPFGSVQHLEVNEAEVDEITYPSLGEGKNLQTMDIKVYNDKGQIVDLQGLEWVVVLKCFY